MNKQKPKTMIILFVFLACIMLLSRIYDARGEITHTDVIISKDAYVWEKEPTTCYGHDTGLVIGNYSANWTEIYVSFNLMKRPAQYLNAVLYFFPLSLDLFKMNITGYIQETSINWDENTITWDNRPTCLSYIEPVNITAPQNIWINLTTFLHRYDASVESTNVSLLLNSTPVNDGNYSIFKSKDWGEGGRIFLRWYYEQAEPFDWTPIIIAVATVGAVVITMTIFLKRKGKGKMPKPKKAKKPAKPATAPGAKPGGLEDLEFET